MVEGRETGKNNRQPIFLLPRIVVVLIGAIVAIHVATVLVFTPQTLTLFTIWFGFIPVRWLSPGQWPGGLLPFLWTPVTHALMHAGWEHLLLNMVWLAIFGTPVARRYGEVRFLIVFFVGAAVGALAFAVATLPDVHVLVGASGGIAGLTGISMRFIFQPVEVMRHPETGEVVILGRRLARLGEMMSNPRTRAFILIWVGLNAVMGLLPIFTGGGEVQIAWQAHLGGFFCGLLIAPLFERRRTPIVTRPPEDQE